MARCTLPVTLGEFARVLTLAEFGRIEQPVRPDHLDRHAVKLTVANVSSAA